MVSLVDRLKNVHPNARKKVSPDAVYVSAGLAEFRITRDDTGYWRVVRWNGGNLPERLKGAYTTHMECEKKLISYLIQTDKFGNRAVYPDGKS